MQLFRSLLHLFVPGLIFAASVYLQFHVVVPEKWQTLLDIFPYLALAAGIVLGWRFNRTRVLWTILLLVLVDRVLIFAPPAFRGFFLLTVSFLVPMNLVLFSWWSERGLLTIHGFARLVILLLETGGLAWLYMIWAQDVMTWLNYRLPVEFIPDELPFSQPVLLIIFLSQIVLLLRFCRKPDALEGAFCWVLPSVMFGFLAPEDFAFWGGVAVFLLAIAIIESSFRMAFNDELTGLPARRAMNEFLLKVGRRYTIALVDIDHFKKVNDTYGHDVGDQVLRMVATYLRRVSGSGRAYRYGGEEFVIIFPSKELERALPHLEELRENIALADFTIRSNKRPRQRPEKPNRKTSGNKKLRVTVSIGAASRDDKLTTPEQLIKAADQALYKAKKGGRNQVCHA